jgi:hypothetical protein
MNRRDFGAKPQPGHDIAVADMGAGAITVTADGKTSRWERIGPGLYEKVTGAGPDGPFDRLQQFQSPAGWRLGIASQPHVLYHQVQP